MHWYFILTEKVPRKETAEVNLKLSLLKSKKNVFSYFPFSPSLKNLVMTSSIVSAGQLALT